MYKVLGFSQEVRILVLGLDNAGKTTILYRLKVGEVVTTIPTSEWLAGRAADAGQVLLVVVMVVLALVLVLVVLLVVLLMLMVLLLMVLLLPPPQPPLPPPPLTTPPPAVGFNVETVKYKNLQFEVWDLGGQTSIRPYWRCYYQNTQAIIYVVDSTDVDRLEISKQELHSMLEEEELKDTLLCVFANKQDMEGALDEAAISEALGLSQLKGRTWTIFKTSATKGVGLVEGLDWLCTQIQNQ